MSPPVRRRGLKRVDGLVGRNDLGSPPVRRRGLKRPRWTRLTGPPQVASRAEAWVETDYVLACNPGAAVASRAEAWVETRPWRSRTRPARSPPVRRRGLKRYSPRLPQRGNQVASRAEAWVETWPTTRRPTRAPVASRAEAWVETVITGPSISSRVSRLPCGGVG